jgi:hypothetical protein
MNVLLAKDGRDSLHTLYALADVDPLTAVALALACCHGLQEPASSWLERCGAGEGYRALRALIDSGNISDRALEIIRTTTRHGTP